MVFEDDAGEEDALEVTVVAAVLYDVVVRVIGIDVDGGTENVELYLITQVPEGGEALGMSLAGELFHLVPEELSVKN